MAENETQTEQTVETPKSQDPAPKAEEQPKDSAVDELTTKFQKRIDKLTASKNDFKDKYEAAAQQLEDLKSGKTTIKDLLKEKKTTNEDKEKDQQIVELKAQLQRERDLQSTREAFHDDGLDVPNDVLNMVVSTNQQQTVNNIGAIKGFVNMIRDTAKKEALRGSTPRTNGKSAATMNKTDISKIKDPVKRVQAIRDNMSLYQ
ncbi:DUF4355 domain-containing protein [uncultured Lentilactobacillus sp.]|uniref:capsid assembly scaffolding protein Gp46 family protein n=1 Tax=uncultured Lentilactobacillus sp. TaxID=2805375 RepID=UPI0025972A52|nr:DUF4355 domain-containing protein [uncultured Lentilactobacillus sp.]